MDSYVFLFEIIGTIAFAVSGAMIGIQKKMDVFGVAILGLTTSIGGGILRDVLIGQIPPATFKNPVYSIVAIITSLVVFIVVAIIRKALKREHFNLDESFHGKRFYDMLLLIMDTVGLAVFTVVGIQVALSVHSDLNGYLLVFVGVLTGVGGGVMRDIMAGSTPYIFVKHIYACASMAGAIVCVLLTEQLGITNASIVGAIVIIAIRLLAARFKWNLPRLR